MAGSGISVARRVGGVAVAMCALGLAACSGGSSSGTPVTGTASSPTVVSSSSSTSASSTLPTVASTSSSASPSPTTSTVAPEASTEAAVGKAIAATQDAYSACLVSMPRCDPAVLANTRAGAILERNVSRINEWNAAGYTVRDRDKFRYVIESVTIDPGLQRASAVVCIADGSKLVLPSPGGHDVIIDGAYGSGREAWDMRLDPDGKWRVYDAPASGPTESRDVCPAG